MRDQSHSSSYMPSKPPMTHPLYSQTLEQHHALLNQYRYSMAAAVSPDGKPVHQHPYSSVPGAVPPMQKTAAVNIIQHEGHTPTKADPTKQLPSPGSPKAESKSEPTSSGSTPAALSPQMAYLPKHWIWNTSLFYAANRSIAAGADPTVAFPHGYLAYGNPFATSGGFAVQRDSYRNDGTSSNTSSSPVQITDVNSDDSSDNHDDLRVSSIMLFRYSSNTNFLIFPTTDKHLQETQPVLDRGAAQEARKAPKTGLGNHYLRATTFP